MSAPTISAIIPTRGDRVATLTRLQAQLRVQTLAPLEIIVITGETTPGKARNRGAQQARGEFLLFLDDDASLDGAEVVAALYATLILDAKIGLTGAAIALPPNANHFQRAYARQFPRSQVEPPSQVVDSDLATTLCCLIKRQLFVALGCFREDLIAGEDPEFRDRVRRAGYRVVLAPQVRVYHPPPPNLTAALRRSFWYGKGDGLIRKLIPAAEWRHSCQPLGLPHILLKALCLPLSLCVDWTRLSEGKVRLRWGGIYALCGYAHILGYLRGRFEKTLIGAFN